MNYDEQIELCQKAFEGYNDNTGEFEIKACITQVSLKFSCQKVLRHFEYMMKSLSESEQKFFETKSEKDLLNLERNLPIIFESNFFIIMADVLIKNIFIMRKETSAPTFESIVKNSPIEELLCLFPDILQFFKARREVSMTAAKSASEKYNFKSTAKDEKTTTH